MALDTRHLTMCTARMQAVQTPVLEYRKSCLHSTILVSMAHSIHAVQYTVHVHYIKCPHIQKQLNQFWCQVSVVQTSYTTPTQRFSDTLKLSVAVV
jgi:hypothetical protein